MTQKEIKKGNKFLDSYMESKGEYRWYEDAYGGEVWGSYKPHNYWGSLDLLVPIIQKIEKENRDVKFHLNNNGCEVKVGKCWEYSSFTLPNWSQNVFAVVVSFLREKNENK